ncbi:hypothetical protein P3X46_015662 [Hevea brasiliensis]|uniref:Glutathione S-transferase n=1 Tax=Hevea brasiliensis TaxID=3981 RepID=A0ABQ9LWT6_HEVBR|nr:hypothetical protein P3X46_015662 [Hevea brasiliensis]
MAEQVKLFSTWIWPFSSRILLALKLKGIKYEYFIGEDLSNNSLLLLKYNPVHKKFPVLVHNGKHVAGSLVILEYVDETRQNNPILPKDPYNRAVARFWAKFIDEKIMQAAYKRDWATEEELDQLNEEVYQNLKLLEKELIGKEFYGGEMYWLHVLREVMQIGLISEEKFPVLCKWMGKLHEIDVVNQCLPPKDKYFAFLKARTGGQAATSASK